MYKIEKHNIIGTKLEIYSAYEPSTITGDHKTITFFDSEVYGRIGTDNKENYEKAYNLIYAEYPQLKEVRHDKRNGQIEVWNN